jgi:hypothetical protein
MRLFWTKEEEDVIRLYAGKKPLKLWAHELPNRRPLAIHQHAYSRMGVSIEVVKTPGKMWWFSCGCSGILPQKGESNALVVWRGNGARRATWLCRVTQILVSGCAKGKERGYIAIKNNTPHALIRELMKANMCWRCKKPMKWIFKSGQTPHLHHNHDTGKIYGFTHPHCNPLALEHQIDEMRDEITRLRKQLDKGNRL